MKVNKNSSGIKDNCSRGSVGDFLIDDIHPDSNGSPLGRHSQGDKGKK